MKQIIVLITVLVLAFQMSAQDVLIRKNGERINCTITKMDSAVIYFTIDRNGNKLNTSIDREQISDISYGNLNTNNNQTANQVGTGQKDEPLPSFSIGLGLGINNYTGLFGVSTGIKIAEKLSLRGGLGIGMWGAKYTIGLKYNMRNNGGWSYGIGYSYCSGSDNMEMPSYDDNGNKTDKKYTIKLLSASTVDFTATRSWKIGRRNTFYLDMGYAIALNNKPWKFVTGNPMTEFDESVYQIYSPGGLIFGFGFTFGLN
jgi:hypothetical protein